MRANPAVAIPSIQQSRDKAWLLGFRTRLGTTGAPELVAAIDERLGQLGEAALFDTIGKPATDLDLSARVREAVRVYEAFLAHKNKGKRIPAAKTQTMIKRLGEKEVVRRAVTTLDMSPGLEQFAKYGRLDCSYEQIVLDFPDEFEPEVRAKAQENLARLQSAS